MLEELSRPGSIRGEKQAVDVSATGRRLQESLVILLAAAGVVFLIISSAVICLILKARQRTDRPPGDASRPASEHNSGIMPMRERHKPDGHYETHQARSEMAQEKAQKNPETTLNHQMNQHQGDDIYENCKFDASSIYANL
ncbi:uncharacterized protein LOC127587261 isoform X2 [Pristis pectinata]|uniref:uncharacterized protein LOC127587261 isoform X2 n=1 Tax=Pristis pectinata TaxID=685728 RepID=UPI00223CA8AC|nr:uncharacterized protein LOC127587261 isoform X2 [Pristis pectinata]